MTDFNKEFELLKEYLAYRINWMAEYRFSGIMIDLSGIPHLLLGPKKLMQLYQEQGFLIVNSNEAHAEHRCLTFEEFKLWPQPIGIL